MYTFMTLGTPHLGYLVKNRSVVTAGIYSDFDRVGFWTIRKWHPSRSLS